MSLKFVDFVARYELVDLHRPRARERDRLELVIRDLDVLPLADFVPSTIWSPAPSSPVPSSSTFRYRIRLPAFLLIR